MPEIISASIVFPLLNFAWRTLQTGYELASVPAATTDHLKTISQVLLDIETARKLRNETAPYLSDDEVKNVNTVIKNTEEALAGLENLVERARVDMQLGDGVVRAPARIMWVMRDSGMANAALSRLSLTSQSLLSQVSMMRQKQFTPNCQAPLRQSVPATSPTLVSHYGTVSSPHLLETTKALGERREWMQRRYSVRSGASAQPYARQPPIDPVSREENDAFFNVRQNVAEWIRDNESVLSDMNPDIYAGPRSELILARDVGSDIQSPGYPTACAELEADPIPAPTSSLFQYSATMPNSPYLSTTVQDPYTESQIFRPHSASPSMVDHTTLDISSHRRSPGSNNPFRPSNQTRNTTSSRFATTLTAGRGERLLTWEEPLAEEEYTSPQESIAQEHCIDDPPPYTTVTGPAAPSARTDIPPVTGMAGRRRPRVYNAGHAQPTVQPEVQAAAPIPSSNGITARSGTVRSNRSRGSRSEWALAQHESEVARIGGVSNAW